MWGVNSIIGRSLVAYEREDDFDQTEFPETADREGRFREGKGNTIACCVIGLAAKAEEKVEHAPILPIDAGKKQISFHGHAGLSQHWSIITTNRKTLPVESLYSLIILI